MFAGLLGSPLGRFEGDLSVRDSLDIVMYYSPRVEELDTVEE
jgi:hypothetical protein